MQPKTKALGHSTKCGFTSDQQRHWPQHQAPRTCFRHAPASPTAHPPVCPSSLPAASCSAVWFQGKFLQEPGRWSDTGPAWPRAVRTAVPDRADAPVGLCQSRPQLEKRLIPGPPKAGHGHPRWAVGGLRCPRPQPSRFEPRSGQRAQVRARCLAGRRGPRAPMSQVPLSCGLDEDPQVKVLRRARKPTLLLTSRSPIPGGRETGVRGHGLHPQEFRCEARGGEKEPLHPTSAHLWTPAQSPGQDPRNSQSRASWDRLPRLHRERKHLVQASTGL